MRLETKTTSSTGRFPHPLLPRNIFGYQGSTEIATQDDTHPQTAMLFLESQYVSIRQQGPYIAHVWTKNFLRVGPKSTLPEGCAWHHSHNKVTYHLTCNAVHMIFLERPRHIYVCEHATCRTHQGVDGLTAKLESPNESMGKKTAPNCNLLSKFVEILGTMSLYPLPICVK